MAKNVDSKGLAEALDPTSTLPIAIIRKGQAEEVEVFSGPLTTADRLADIALDGLDVIAAVPFQQIRERGFDAIPDDSDLLYLTAENKWVVPAEELTELLPQTLPSAEGLGFNISDEEYAALVEKVIEDEIGTGEGANFVIRRDYRAHTTDPMRQAALAWFRQLLEGERGAYWTFAFITEDLALVGASPERHVSATDGTVLMNPISGTFRHGSAKTTADELLAFLADRKESEELVMVVDEELKMMSAVCPAGGVMRGPFLKPMSRVTHTEYLLEGKSDLDVREILRLTMFAPTVIGSPMGSACTVISEYEPTGRGYYSGVLAHFHPGPHGYTLDAPILIRTAQISKSGDVTVSAGATLVRHSDPQSEAEETKAKVSGVLTALGLLSADTTAAVKSHADVAADPLVLRALEERNRDLAPFWRDEQFQHAKTAEGTALVLDFGDDFTTMLAHQLRHLGLEVNIVRWDQVDEDPSDDLLIFGPGPGDPNNDEDPRVKRAQELLLTRLAAGKPTIAVCFSHQVLSALAGLPVTTLDAPRQGQPLKIDLLGKESLIGFYNTFAARGENGSTTPTLELTAHSEPDTGIVHSLTAPGVGSVQGHLESVLSFDGFEALGCLVDHALTTAPSPRSKAAGN